MQFLIEQKSAIVTNAYFIYKSEGDSKKELFAYVQQKRFAMREKITFYSDESMKQQLFTLRGEKVVDIHGKYFIEDELGNMLGYFRRNFKASLLRTTWHVYTASDVEVLVARERNQYLAVMRRLGDYIPYIGALFNFLPYHFDFIRDKHIVGGYSRKISLRDKYLLSYDDDLQADERLFAGFGIALDVLQSR